MAIVKQASSNSWPYRLLWLVTGGMALLWWVGFRNFQVDDTGIYAHVMRNWQVQGAATFNTIDPAFPITSYLWFLGNMALVQLLQIAAIYDFLRLMSVVCYFATWLIFFAAVKRFMRSPYLIVGTTMLLITDEIAMEYAASGMDTALGVLMTALNLYLLGTWAEGIGGGLAIATRPEGLFLAAAQLGVRLLRRDWRRVLLIVGGMGSVLLGVLLAMQPFTTTLTNTVQMKSSDFSLFLSVAPNLQRLVLIVGAFSAWPLLLALLLGRRTVAAALGPWLQEPVVQVGLLFVAATCASYLALLNGDFLKARYLAVLTPYVYLLLGLLVDKAVGQQPERAKYWLLAWLVNLALILTAGLANARTNYDTYLRRLVEADLIKQHAQPGDTIFTAAIGVLGYETDLQVLDAAGLATPAAIKPIRPEDCSAMLNTYQPDFVIQLAPVASFQRVATVAWPECKLDFVVELVDQHDLALFDDGWFVWKAPTLTRVALYRITHWTPVKA